LKSGGGPSDVDLIPKLSDALGKALRGPFISRTYTDRAEIVTAIRTRGAGNQFSATAL